MLYLTNKHESSRSRRASFKNYGTVAVTGEVYLQLVIAAFRLYVLNMLCFCKNKSSSFSKIVWHSYTSRK